MSYPGGKSGGGAYQRIISQMPPHDVYCEPFLGGGAILLNKRLSNTTFAGDLDARAVAAVKRALPDSPAVRNSAATIRMELRARDRRDRTPPGIAAVDVAVRDALGFLGGRTWGGAGLVYCDPPYLRELRKSQGAIYEHEFWTRDQHAALLDLLKGLGCMVIISGYPSRFYNERLPRRIWRRIEFQGWCRAGATTEALWLNYGPPRELHDSSYLGDDRRERERIRRKAARWVNRFESLPDLERFAILEKLASKKLVGHATTTPCPTSEPSD